MKQLLQFLLAGFASCALLTGCTTTGSTTTESGDSADTYPISSVYRTVQGAGASQLEFWLSEASSQQVPVYFKYEPLQGGPGSILQNVETSDTLQQEDGVFKKILLTIDPLNIGQVKVTIETTIPGSNPSDPNKNFEQTFWVIVAEK